MAVDFWGVLWINFFGLAVARFRAFTFADGYVWASAVIPFVLLQLSFVFSIWTPFTHHLELASERLCLHGIAIAWYWIALQAGSLDDWFKQWAALRARRVESNSFGQR
ncbi:MAG: hypothetical protein B6D41_00430 [Chloroflexi bacterium UTCFX4]|jgi:hypothetical protein|nr:MAG: hypothetical protein B6D41_00430 [Chloroflexi bacterium UTCFX4]